VSVEVLRLASDALELELLPQVGARWHRLRAFGQDVLRTPPNPAMHAGDPFFWGAYVMAPWCNRLPAGPMEWQGQVIDLAPNFPDGTAIHGQVYDRPWEMLADGRLQIDAGGDGWPWAYRVVQRLALSGATLRVELSVENRSQAPMPAGLGMHPWFPRPVRVAIDAADVYPSNAASPAEPEPVRGALDMRTLGTPATGLDATWTRLGDPAVRLAWPSGLTCELRLGDGASHVVLASPEEPDAVAIEPQSQAPNGMRRTTGGEPGGLTVLAPGSRLAMWVEARFQQP
jgi:aldose 1-epimerase